MADTALFIGWREAKMGRENHARELFGRTVAFWGEQVAAGKIESFQPVLLSRHGGDLNGFMLIQGDESAIDELRRSEGFRNIVTQATYCLDGFGVIEGYVNEKLKTMMAEWGAVVAKG